MEKEFEALKRIRQETAPATYNPDFDKKECCDVIEQALQRLEAIDNAKPSEALECWQWINATIPQWVREKDKEHPNVLEPIKQYILKAQEQEKENKKLKSKLNRWLELLESDGINSKNMVATDIQQLLEEIDK